ncbi:MAG: cardiolipin synthase [Desulfofustis sp.]|jgi:cardiolipin synthase|nr:cardiolipin synthase [Desulfofustis sp.]
MTEESAHWIFSVYPTLVLLADLTVRIGLSIRVIMRKRPYGITFAWLFVILLFPFAGAIFYLFFGENRISDKRAARARQSQDHYQYWLNSLKNRSPVKWDEKADTCLPLHNQAEKLIGIPALAGNHLELIDTPEEILQAIVDDIRGAKSTCHLQFYIWQEGGMVSEIENALLEVAGRGVTCRILLDSIGSSEFLKGQRAKTLMDAGIMIQASLPAGIIKTLFARIDIRNHRKIVVIDGEIAYTGSQNMVDPKYFKQESGIGEWVDVMVRITGPVVESLAGTFVSDWYLESDDQQATALDIGSTIHDITRRTDVHQIERTGDTPVQLVPSGPGLVPDAIHSLLLTTIYSARDELVLTTPYFVPDESLLTALKSAAQRRVNVTVILPQRNDSKLIHYASQAHFFELARSGVRIMQFRGGLLHSKTITVDREFCLFGSVNLDMRSFWLNFEATLFIYDRLFADKIRTLQARYEDQSEEIDVHLFERRPVINRFMENLALLLGPLL